ncbi:MAG: MFS transporter [Gammaproteobacteria bacterium TMED95]|nr:MFS transporter [Gammaproteobacteria bacterium]OUV21457.1 MAG: MFS transporter [Gammaproteobacteria bacterium TMED95]
MSNPIDPTPSVFSPAVRNYALGVLVVVYTFNFIDRQILSILLEPIKQDLRLSDTALGMLTGFAFALFYATLGIPIARLADRGNRRNIIAWSLTIWSAMTALSGIAQNFWHLLIARIGVGVGEAGCSPPAHSMIADYFPAENRATALGIYSLGIPVGILFGFIAGGWLNEFFGWRVAFFVVGVPGILLALLVRWSLREPDRGMAEGRQANADQPGIMETFTYLYQKPSFRHMAIGGGLTAFVGYGIVTWVPSFLIRSYGMDTGEVGTYLGLILGIPGGIGIALGGYLADRYGAKDTRWYLWVVTVALLIAVPITVGVYLSSSATASLLFLILPVLLGNFYQATTFSQAQGLVPLRMRAVAAAVLLFILNIIGLGAGPQMVGVVSDLLAPTYGDESLRYALLALSFVNIWAAYHYYLAGKTLKQDLVIDPSSP